MTEEFALSCRGICKTFGRVRALDGFELQVRHGQVLALLGPSGCGKTTALRIIAGFEQPDAGVVEIGGRVVAAPGVRVPPEKRRVGLVFQDYALFPHMNVLRNVAYGLPRGRSKQRLAELLRMAGLEGLEDRMPHQLSGGQQQRVALARTLASEPQVLLLDEPFSNLDVKLRAEVRAEVKRLIQEAGTTTVFVTHDQEEAFVLADTIVVMNQGRVEQVGTPQDLYYRPASRFVADFVGVANFLPGRVSRGTLACELGEFETECEAEGAVDVLVRPDAIGIGPGEVRATVVSREFLGHDLTYALRLPSGRVVRTIQMAETLLEPGAEVAIYLRGGPPVVFEGQALSAGSTSSN